MVAIQHLSGNIMAAMLAYLIFGCSRVKDNLEIVFDKSKIILDKSKIFIFDLSKIIQP